MTGTAAYLPAVTRRAFKLVKGMQRCTDMKRVMRHAQALHAKGCEGARFAHGLRRHVSRNLNQVVTQKD